MPSYYSPALLLAEYGNEELWRQIWRLNLRFYVRHHVSCCKHLKPNMTDEEVRQLVRNHMPAIAKNIFGVESYRQYMSIKRKGLELLKKELSGDPDISLGGVGLFKYSD